MFIGKEFESSNAFIAYPFTDSSYASLNFDQASPDYAADARLPANALLDIVLITGPDVCAPLYLNSLYYDADAGRVHAAVGCSPVPDADLEYTVADGELGEGAETLTFVIAGAGREMYTIPGSDTQARAIITPALQEFLTARGGYVVVPADKPLVFDTSVIDRRAARLESLAGPMLVTDEYEYEYEYAVPGVAYSRILGDVTLLGGYNIALQSDDTANGIVIGAAPGAGDGVVPCGDPAVSYDGLTSQLGAGDHNLQIVGDDCYEIAPTSADTLTISGGCDACCDCEDYLAILDEIARLRVVNAALAARINSVVAAYHKYLGGADCRRIKLVPRDRSVTLIETSAES